MYINFVSALAHTESTSIEKNKKLFDPYKVYTYLPSHTYSIYLFLLRLLVCVLCAVCVYVRVR